MASNQNLVATPVTDKNGVVTTRWKRPVSPSAGAANIPAPPVPSSSTNVSDEASEASYASRFDLTIGLNAMLIKEKAPDWVLDLWENSLHPDTLPILDSHFKDDYLRILPFMQRCIREGSVASFNNAAVFVDMIDGFGNTNEERHDNYERAVFGLQWRYQLVPLDFSEEGSNNDAGRALLRAAHLLGQPYVMEHRNGAAGMTYFPSNYLTGLIAERPDDVDAIVELLRTRRLPVFEDKDIDAIKGLLDENEVSSLGSGVL